MPDDNAGTAGTYPPVATLANASSLTNSQQQPAQVRILAVLVLYRCALENATTWRLLQPQVESLPPAIVFRLLVCDNGPPADKVSSIPDWVEYVVAEENRGLAWAYNFGLTRAQEMKAAWLLTLDQDSSLPADFLSGMLSALSLAGEQERLGAIVPQLVGAKGNPQSPMVVRLGREVSLSRGFTGIAVGDVRAFNSCSLFRVEVLVNCGGYDPRFWLDYLDHATFHAFHKHRYKVWVAGNIQVEHHLSLHDGREQLSGQRFENFSMAESAFRDLYASRLVGFIFTVRLFLRSLNQLRRRDPAHFRKSTQKVLALRLRHGRRFRIQFWERQMRTLYGPVRTRVVDAGSTSGNSDSAA